MRFQTNILKVAKRTVTFLAAVMLAKIAVAATGKEGSAPALTNWQVALASFQKAGGFIGQAKYPQAKAELSVGATNLPAPYRTMASQYLERLESGAKQSSKQERAEQLSAFGELCLELRAYPAAVQLRTQLRKASSEQEEGQGVSLAWCLLETGDAKGAMAQYKRKASEEKVEMWQNYYRKQIQLIQERTTNLTSLPFAIEFVREHYLKAFEEKADNFGALKELTRALPYAKDRKELLTAYQFVCKNLSDLEDESGAEAWENKILSEFASDREASASVRLDQALRAFRKKNTNESLTLLRKLCVEYPETAAYGDAQYDIGLLLHEGKKYAEAIVEYDKLFLSQANDYLTEPASTEDAKNYRFKAAMRISECYEAQKEYARALEYAELARDRYKFIGFCQICLETVRNQLAERITTLQALAKKPEPAAK